ncbi:hypothetical protein BGI41_00805 [Methanobrevibacter sp. 87.7]|uniref:hypothetical protein n=1 Tax=Methanobrevibacter sp. 87.7 TaxID=387957 RepID=UPI000B511CCD|nr:hypothetical protein [Methanobrevibacter sp. 87.7]OWT33736.1 hypothetical protein BGI41_00805 [Methanobrevibacter sp. 87.7]
MNLKISKLWNPIGFFISFFMSFLMPLIFAVPFGFMPINVFLYQELIRWPVAYFIVTLFVIPLSLNLAKRYFTFPPKGHIFNPVTFFISLQMSFLMPLIFGYAIGSMPLKILFIMWPVRWVVAYAMVNFAIRPFSMNLTKITFNFEPQH